MQGCDRNAATHGIRVRLDGRRVPPELSVVGVALPPGHTNHGEHVFEVGRPRRERRSGGKTDALDAVRPGPSLFEHPPLTT
jgi:hypothetical protein